jgi:hypothetical protein
MCDWMVKLRLWNNHEQIRIEEQFSKIEQVKNNDFSENV